MMPPTCSVVATTSVFILYNKIVQRVIDGHIEVGIAIGDERGEARGKAEGIAEGEARMRAQFMERLGVPFDEPMPGADSGINGHSPRG